MKGAKQTTLRDQVAVSGIGVHSGSPVNLTLNPADDDTGIVFQRVSSDGSIEREIRADVRAVTATEFATVLGDAKGPLCSTAEHLLATLRGLGVDNVVVEIDGPEVPIMDGSAAAFVDAIDQAGLTAHALPRRYIEVIKPVRVSKDGAQGELRPYQHGFRVEAEIEFDHPLIGRLALAGQPLLAAYRTVRGGHKLNHAVLSALMADRSAWRVIEATEPARRARGHAQVGAGRLAAAYGPEMS